MTSFLRWPFVSGEIPTGEGSVFHFLDIYALGFGLEACAALFLGKSWGWVALGVAGSILFHLLGTNWPRIKPKVQPRFASAVELISSSRIYRKSIFVLIIIAFLGSVGFGIYRRYHSRTAFVPPQAASQSINSSGSGLQSHQSTPGAPTTNTKGTNNAKKESLSLVTDKKPAKKSEPAAPSGKGKNTAADSPRHAGLVIGNTDSAKVANNYIDGGISTYGNTLDAEIRKNEVGRTTAGLENAGKAERILFAGNTVQPSAGNPAQLIKNDPGSEMKDVMALNNEVKAAPIPPPPMSQVCAPGASCAMSNGQQGGVTAGTYIGNPPPRITVVSVSRNTFQDDLYESKFKCQVITSQAIMLHVKARSANLVGVIGVDNERPPSEGGMSFTSTSKGGLGYAEQDFSGIESAVYVITVKTSRPENVILECY
jgi:hypothetical protein